MDEMLIWISAYRIITKMSSLKGWSGPAQLPRAVVESPSVQGFNRCGEVAPGDMVNDGLGSAGLLTTLS